MSLLSKKDALLLSSIKEFVESYDGHFLGRTRWFNGNIVNVYIRNTHRHFAGDYFRTVEVGSISIADRYRGKGIYSAFLAWLYELTPVGAALFVENVLFPEHYALYTRRNFFQYGSLETTGSVSFIKVRA